MFLRIMSPTPNEPARTPNAAHEPTEKKTSSISSLMTSNQPQPKAKLPLLFIAVANIIGVIILISLVVIFWKIISKSSAGIPTPTFTLTMSPTLTVTSTPLPSSTYTPSPSVTFTPTPSATFTATLNLIPSNTPAPTASETLWLTETFKPGYTKTPTRIKAVCPCSQDLYDCKDFNTHALAQACYDYCVLTGWGDAHNLDKSGTGIVCKGLP